ncbi:MAG: chorismate mutase [bacterium]|nr:chorismate mutase [bacterium]
MKVDMALEDIRKQIDEIDRELLGLVYRRVGLAKRAGEIKKKNGDEIYDPVREKEIIESKSQEAEELGLDPVFATELYKTIIGECRRVQK